MNTIAFIPVRGGSKSIPLKNIKEFCGKPLVYWTISALQQVNLVDEIVVATDCELIEEVVLSFHFSKVSIYHRSKENATDVSSTESVILEYLNKVKLPLDTVLMLVQATSPLTEAIHFEEALSIYRRGEFDSMLSCVRNYRFFWNEDGTSKNYDYRSRPRRQDFAGELMENGAFYINTVHNIFIENNRLSGKIGIYIMPEYTAMEIDEPDDWNILETLMIKHVLNNQHHIKHKIKLFLSDVDGVLTDAGMYYSEDNNELKKFNTRDGMAFQLLREAGIKTGIVTSENTKIVEVRAKKMNVDYLYQGERAGGKLKVVLELCKKENITLNEVAYIGDDINCRELLLAVGVKACPSDAHSSIKQIPGIIHLTSAGGAGVVREFVDYILND